MSKRAVSAIVLAVDSEDAMNSSRPKPLHMICGQPMGSYVLNAMSAAGVAQAAVVASAESNKIGKRLLEHSPQVALRTLDMGKTSHGDAALAALSELEDLSDDEDVIITTGDIPLVTASTVTQLLDVHRSQDSACTALSGTLTDVTQIKAWPEADVVVRSAKGSVFEVLDPEMAETLGLLAQPEVEIAFSFYVAKRDLLAASIRRVAASKPDVCIRDIVRVIAESGNVCTMVQADNYAELQPVTNQVYLSQVEAELRQRRNLSLLSQGVSIVDPANTYVDATVKIGKDVTLFPGTHLRGSTTVADGCQVGPNAKLESCTVGERSVIEYSVCSAAVVGKDCKVGPYANIGPGSELDDETVTGPYFHPSEL